MIRCLIFISQSSNLQQFVSKNGTHGNQWLPLQVQLSVSGSKQIIIEGVRGNNYLGDIAIDDIHVVSGTCSSQGNILN